MSIEWQPIETAPKDGSWVLLAGGRDEDERDYVVIPSESGEEVDEELEWVATSSNGSPRPAALCFFDQGRGAWFHAFWDQAWRSQYSGATHWAPLSKPAVEPRFRLLKTPSEHQ